jgi:hypothetical protein
MRFFSCDKRASLKVWSAFLFGIILAYIPKEGGLVSEPDRGIAAVIVAPPRSRLF